MWLIEMLEPRLQMARPDPSLGENVRFRLPLATDTTTHYYFDRDDTAGDLAWNGTSQSYNGHKGTDFSGGPRNKPVYAAADGILIAKVDGLPDGDINTPGNGNYVRLNHGNDRTGKPINSVYLHFNAGSVTTKAINSFVTSGEQIGGVGTSGHSTGLHLHMETQLARVAFDPYASAGETSWWVNQGSGTPSTTSNTAKLKAGDAVQVYDLPGSTLNVRSTAAGTSIGSAVNNALGTVLEGPTFAAFNGDYNNGLWVWYRVRWDNGLVGWSTQNWLRKPADLTAPTVSAAAFGFETAPHKLNITFSENVAASISASDLAVTRIGSTDPLANSLSYDVATNKATLNFNTVLPDGIYRLRIPAGALNDVAGNVMAGEYTYDFHVLGGDITRDKRVDFDDLVLLAQNYGKTGQTFGQGNIDYDTIGNVNFTDLVVLAQRYGTSMTVTPPLSILSDVDKKRRPPLATSLV